MRRGEDAWTMDLVALCCSSIWLIVVAVLILRAASQRALLPRLAPNAAARRTDAPPVAVIVPARDEADNIGPCIRSLLAQDFPADRCAIVVVDDHSADATPQIVADLSRAHPRLRLLRSSPLPRGWTGKSHACWLGARAIAPDTEWLCFIDADMRAAPTLLASAVRSAEDEALDLLSLAPRQVLGSFAERLVIPCGLMLLAFLQDLAARQARQGDDATATGQFMLIRASAYDAIGGHAAIRAAICEDLELARRCKRSGRAVLLKDGRDMLWGRMYTGWRTLWPGFAKNAVDMLGGPRATVAAALASIVLAWAAPVVPALAALVYVQTPGPASLPSLAMALLASAAVFALHIAAARHFRIPPWYGLMFPLGYTAGALIAADSIRRRRQARVAWKGRVYS
jgi:chlorobactene glucosyltransferase